MRQPEPPKRPVLAFLVNGTPESAMGIRTQEFAKRLLNDFQIHIAYREARKVRSILTFLSLMRKARPDVCYVVDMGYSGVVAAVLYRSASGCRIITDTGDAIYELARSMGRGPLGLLLTKILEFTALRISRRLVVRSHFHQEWLARRGFVADVIPDGVDTRQFRPLGVKDLRCKYALEGFKTIGVLGSVVWNEATQTCYGWDLIELIHILRDQPVKGLIVGSGSGIAHLKARCLEYGLESRILFLGFIPYSELPEVLNMMDICLSTQSNDIAGQVRTTGKLPLYLACGRVVLATRVGEAARILPSQFLFDYDGVKDLYPHKLAAQVTRLWESADPAASPDALVRLAREHFEYSTLCERLKQTVRSSLS